MIKLHIVYYDVLLFPGAFLFPYVLMLAFIGLPMFFLELCFGQFSSLGPIKIWLVSPLSKGRWEEGASTAAIQINLNICVK